MEGGIFLVAVLVMVVLLVYRVVGCGTILEVSEATFVANDYTSLVDKAPGLVAHWRLSDPASSTVAVDKVQPPPPPPPPPPTPPPPPVLLPNGLRPGTYEAFPGPVPADDPQSATAPGTVNLDQPGLLQNDAGKSAAFNGGFVRVPFAVELNPPKFTIEAWVNPSWTPETPPKFYSVVTSRQDDGAKRGYMLYAGPPVPVDTLSPTLPPGIDTTKTFWQFWIGVGDPTLWVRLIGPEVQLGKTVHLVAACDGTQMKLWVDGGKEEGGAFVPTAERTTTKLFVANQTRPLVIGSGKTDKDPPASPRYPFIGRIQDVAIYNTPGTEVRAHFAKGTDFKP